MITEYLCCSNKLTSENIQKFETDHTFEPLHFIFISCINITSRVDS